MTNRKTNRHDCDCVFTSQLLLFILSGRYRCSADGMLFYGANIMTKQFEFELCKFELLTSVI